MLLITVNIQHSNDSVSVPAVCTGTVYCVRLVARLVVVVVSCCITLPAPPYCTLLKVAIRDEDTSGRSFKFKFAFNANQSRSASSVGVFITQFKLNGML